MILDLKVFAITCFPFFLRTGLWISLVLASVHFLAQVSKALKNMDTRPLNSLVTEMAKTTVRELDGLKEMEEAQDEAEAEVQFGAEAADSESD